MAKLTLNSVLSGFLSVVGYNSNNTLLEAALENTLSRDGTSPNTMEAQLDMNSNAILNVAAPPNGTAAARLVDISDSDATGAATAQLRIDLAANSGSSLVGFLQAGTGAVARTSQNKNRDIASIKDFGALGDGVTNDTVAIQTAVNYAASIGGYVWAPTGVYKTGAISFPAGVKGFLGSGMGATKFSITGAITAYTPVFKFNTLTNFHIGNFSIDANVVTYATNHATQFDTCVNGIVEGIQYIGGGFIGCHTPGSSYLTIKDCIVDTFVVSAFLVDTCSYMTLDNVRTRAYGASHTIDVRNGFFNKVINSHAVGPASGGFGILLYAEADSTVMGCSVSAPDREGIQITNSNRCSILDNEILCLGTHNDFGISVFAESADIKHNKVSGNTIYNSGKAGIGISSSTVPPQTCTLNMVSDNLIINPNVTGGIDGAGVLLLGGVGCTENVVENNRCIDQGNKMTYGALEVTGADYNVLKHNSCVGGAVFVQEHGIVGANSVAFDLSWVSYATTVTSTAGALTTASGTVKYKRKGKEADMSVTATITDNGTGSGGIKMTVPFTVVNGVINGKGMSVSGKQVHGYLGTVAGTILIVNYDNTYPAATGELLRLSGNFEI